MNKIYALPILVLALLACAGFQYKYFGVGPDANGEMKGTVLGKTAAEDQPLTVCAPDAVTKGKCVLMFVDEFERMKADLEVTKELLKKCQEGQ